MHEVTIRKPKRRPWTVFDYWGSFVGSRTHEHEFASFEEAYYWAKSNYPDTEVRIDYLPPEIKRGKKLAEARIKMEREAAKVEDEKRQLRELKEKYEPATKQRAK